MSNSNKNNTHCFFFVFVVIACLIALLAFYACSNSHKDSIEHIIKCQEEQADVMDSSLFVFHQQIEELSISKEEALKKIISDPILAKLPQLSAKESQNIAKYVEAAIVSSGTEYILVNALNEYENVILSTRWNQLQSDTKALLELEMSKIQNEHETLGIWAALLTIVFLIFSFYSLFKTDDLVKQGQDGLDKLNEIKKEALKNTEEIKLQAEKKFDKFNSECNETLRNADISFTKRLDDLESSIKRREGVIKRGLEREIADINILIAQKKEELVIIEEKVRIINDEHENKLRHFDMVYNKLEARLNLLEQKYSSIKFEIDESVKEK